MSKAKANLQTPSEMVANAVETQFAIDLKGRRIEVRQLNALQVYRLTKVLGSTASNPAAADMATLACTVVKIDAKDIALPATEREVEFLIQQLGFEGLGAAAEALKKFAPDDESEEAELEAAKN